MDENDPPEFTVRMVNSRENWDLLEETGVHWFAENETMVHLDVVVRSQKDLDTIKEALNASSLPYP